MTFIDRFGKLEEQRETQKMEQLPQGHSSLKTGSGIEDATTAVATSVAQADRREIGQGRVNLIDQINAHKPPLRDSSGSGSIEPFSRNPVGNVEMNSIFECIKDLQEQILSLNNQVKTKKSPQNLKIV